MPSGLEPRPAASCTGRVRGTIVFIALLLLASCTAERDQEPSPDPTASPSSVACPLTRPNGSNPPRQRGPGQASPLSHGNGRLWVELYRRGVIRPANYGRALPNGTIAVKFPWTRGVEGRLTITGRRLDAPAPPARARIPKGYGRTGFQSTAVLFPTTGCWEVTGRVAGASLTFVTRVAGPVR